MEPEEESGTRKEEGTKGQKEKSKEEVGQKRFPGTFAEIFNRSKNKELILFFIRDLLLACSTQRSISIVIKGPQ